MVDREAVAAAVVVVVVDAAEAVVVVAEAEAGSPVDSRATGRHLSSAGTHPVVMAAETARSATTESATGLFNDLANSIASSSPRLVP